MYKFRSIYSHRYTLRLKGARMVVKFQVDADGLLTVSAREKTVDKETSIEINRLMASHLKK